MAPQSTQGEIILHHYDTSPFSEKVRVMLGVKGLSWRSVIQPVIMPKPELTPLTGGYRRIPVLQIGADVYCDTQVILAELEARQARPAVIKGADWAVNLWADRLFFQVTVAVVFGEIGDHVPAEFIADREKLSGRPFDIAAMKAAAPPMKAQWRAHAAWIERGLASNDFLGGSTPSLADVAAYMNIWWLGRAAPGAAAALLDGLPKTTGWRERIKALGHGRRTDMTGAEALAAAKAATPASAPSVDAADPSRLKAGAAVAVRADDYGRDPVEGRLVSATPDRIIIARESDELGVTHVHFPRVGYLLSAA
jgi:glutathione S-transferase